MTLEERARMIADKRGRPIIFSGPMVRAILDGRKTQTRRIIKPQPFPVGGPFYQPHPVTNPREWHSISRDGHIANIQTVRHAPGDLLWVRESWAHDGPDLETVRARHEDAIPGIGYGPYYQSTETAVDTLRWRPSIHMPRWASRITLDVEAVKVERLQDISERDAKAESAAFTCEMCGNDLDTEEGSEVHAACADPECELSSHKEGFRRIWFDINGEASWDANPWVTAITFKAHLQNIDKIAAVPAAMGAGGAKEPLTSPPALDIARE